MAGDGVNGLVCVRRYPARLTEARQAGFMRRCFVVAAEQFLCHPDVLVRLQMRGARGAHCRQGRSTMAYV
jgi:hypothetical protein